MRTTIVALADIHNSTSIAPLPEGDILLVAGDLCSRGTMEELSTTTSWLARQRFETKVVIAGNHDWCLDDININKKAAQQLLKDSGCIYLRDEMVTLRGLRIYGSPWTPAFGNWAFNLDYDQLRERWAKIPEGLDVLLVHGPPLGYGDMTTRGQAVGDPYLLEAIDRCRPKNVFFGHIHEAGGSWSRGENTMLFNCTVGHIYSGPRRWQRGGAPVVISMEKNE